MKKLKIIFHSNYFYIFLFIFLLFYVFINYSKNNNYYINIKDNIFEGIITDYKIKNDLLTLEVKGQDKIVSFYYFKNEIEKDIFLRNYNYGDKVLLSGSFSIPSNNTIFNLFNYKNYLKSKKIYVVMNCDSITKINNNNNLIFYLRNIFDKHIDKFKSKAYLFTFILGNKNFLDENIYESFQVSGVSHLLAISGMHISLLSCFILLFLKKFGLNDNISYCIVISFLLMYMFIIGITPSVLRSILLFILIYINKKFNFNINIINLFFIVLFLVLLFNPFYIYDVGFLYSFIISFYLILFKDKLKNNYFLNLFLISFVSFFASLPITLYYFYEINFLGILLNLIFVPIISLFIFPLSLLTFFIPILDNVLFFFTNILNNITVYFSNISFFTITFGRPHIIFIIIYYLLFTYFFFFDNKKFFYMIIILLFIFYNKTLFIKNSFITFLDVGQGDSILIHKNNTNILIDTGGKYNSDISNKKIIPFFKSLGIRNINYLITTHGDFDHMGEAINLVNNFKVEKVIFNCGEFNDLEKELIKVLDNKKIKYYSCIKELSIDNNKLYFFQTKEYENENDNSNVIYTELNGYKFIFMGDAGVTTEKEILDKYNISDIDVLKVGHHGSKTSSSKEFINEINPKYSIISVGKYNRYGHPNKEVLKTLNNSKIYRTDQDGSIMFKIKNNKLKIETCTP